MPCSRCQQRAALVAALAPAISRLSFTREGLLDLLSLPNEELLAAAKIKDAGMLVRQLAIAPLSETVPTALCPHDLEYPPHSHN